MSWHDLTPVRMMGQGWQTLVARQAYLRLGVAALLDLIDATVGLMFGWGFVTNALVTTGGLLLLGVRGGVQFWEWFDPTHIVGGMVPTLTLMTIADPAWGAAKKMRKR